MYNNKWLCARQNSKMASEIPSPWYISSSSYSNNNPGTAAKEICVCT